jgi:hypothetical protein
LHRERLGALRAVLRGERLRHLPRLRLLAHQLQPAQARLGVVMQRAVVKGNTMAGPAAIQNDIPDCGDPCAILANVH